MTEVRSSIALPVRVVFLRGIPAIILDTGLADHILSDLYLPNGRTFMTEQKQPPAGGVPGGSRIGFLKSFCMDLLSIFMMFVLGSLLGVGIFAVLFFCSIVVDWLPSKFNVSPDVAMACGAVELLILWCGVISACIIIAKTTYDFIRALLG